MMIIPPPTDHLSPISIEQIKIRLSNRISPLIRNRNNRTGRMTGAIREPDGPECTPLVHSYTRITTRRFSARPVRVELSAMGCSLP